MIEKEVAWLKRLDQAFENISDEELQTNVFNDYDEIITFYEGKKKTLYEG